MHLASSFEEVQLINIRISIGVMNMKKLLSTIVVAGILSFFSSLSFAQMNQVNAISSSPLGANLVCPIAGTPGFCGCMETSMIQGCIQHFHPRNPNFCSIGHIIVMINAIGIRLACAQDSNPTECALDLNSYINNNPSNNPHCPLN
jgi:hypothetical protein